MQSAAVLSVGYHRIECNIVSFLSHRLQRKPCFYQMQGNPTTLHKAARKQISWSSSSHKIPL